jgi:hypothetical protein
MPGPDRFLREIKVADASHMRGITQVSSRSARAPKVEGADPAHAGERLGPAPGPGSLAGFGT